MKTLEGLVLHDEQYHSICSLWGMDGELSMDPRIVRQKLVRRMQDPLAARFVWEYLMHDERLLLWHCLGKKTREGVLVRRVLAYGLLPSQERLDAATTSLSEKLLIEVSNTPKTDGTTLYAYRESVDALYATGGELFSPGVARMNLDIEKLLPDLDKNALWNLVRQYRLVSLGITTTLELRKALADALADEEIIQHALALPEIQHTQIPEVIAWLNTQNGCAFMHTMRKRFSLTDDQLFGLLHVLERSGLAFDTLCPEEDGVRQLFVPLIRRVEHSAVRYQSVQDTSEIVGKFAPSIVIEGIPRVVFDLATAINATYQRRIDLTSTTSAPRVAERCAKQLRPLLLLGRIEREANEGFTFLDLLFRTMETIRVIEREEPPLILSRLTSFYKPGPGLSMWKNRTLVEQTRILLDLWIEGKIWRDLFAADFHQWDITDWHPELGRPYLLSLLKECHFQTWYRIDDFLTKVWERDPYHMRPALAERAKDLHPTSILKTCWWKADGAFLRGCLCSTLFELGIVSLGTDSPVDSQHIPVQATAFQLTSLGMQVLQESPSEVIVDGIELSPSLLISATFEVHLLGEDLPTLYELLPWSEVLSLSPQVAHLRFTTTSIQKGIHHGLQLSHLLSFLELRTTHSIPQNVVYSLREWANKFTEIQVTQGVILFASNETTAKHLAHAPTFRGFRLRQVAPQVLIAPFHVNILELRRLLEKEHIASVRLINSVTIPTHEHTEDIFNAPQS